MCVLLVRKRGYNENKVSHLLVLRAGCFIHARFFCCFSRHGAAAVLSTKNGVPFLWSLLRNKCVKKEYGDLLFFFLSLNAEMVCQWFLAAWKAF